MPHDPTQSPAVLLSDVPATDKPKWIQIAYEGEWKGHHYGPFKLNRDDFARIVRNFREHPAYKQGGGSDVVPFDFDHASEMPVTQGRLALDGKPAQGWVRELEVRDGTDGKAQLWAFSRVLEPARSYLKDGKIKWVSSAIVFDALDPVSGKPIGPMLTSVAFTNTPFLRALPAIAASARPNTHQQGFPMPTEPQKNLQIPILLATLQLPFGATEEDITQKVVAMDARLKALETEIAQLKGENADTDVASAMMTYKIGEQSKPALLSFRKTDPEGFKKVYPPPPAGMAQLGQKIVGDPPGPTMSNASRVQLGGRQPSNQGGGALSRIGIGPNGRAVLMSGNDQQVDENATIEFAKKLMLVPGRNKFERAMNFVRSQPGGKDLTHEECHVQAGLMLVQNGIPRDCVDVHELFEQVG